MTDNEARERAAQLNNDTTRVDLEPILARLLQAEAENGELKAKVDVLEMARKLNSKDNGLLRAELASVKAERDDLLTRYAVSDKANYDNHVQELERVLIKAQEENAKLREFSKSIWLAHNSWFGYVSLADAVQKALSALPKEVLK